MPTKKLLLNIPVTVSALKYVDVVGGKFGAQVRIKGVIDGEADTAIYLPGKLWAVARVLKNAGVIPQDVTLPEELAEGAEPIKVPFDLSEFTLVNKQVPGKTYANLEVQGPAKPDPTPEWLKGGDEMPFDKPETPVFNGTTAGQTATLVAPVNGASPTPNADRVAALFRVYDRCLAHALMQTKSMNDADVGDTPEAASARAATLFIQINQRGLV